MFLLYYKDFFEQICSDVQFISPPEEVGEFLLHLLNPETNLAAFSLNIANNTPVITNGITKTPHSQNPIFIAYSSFTNWKLLVAILFAVKFKNDRFKFN